MNQESSPRSGYLLKGLRGDAGGFPTRLLNSTSSASAAGVLRLLLLVLALVAGGAYAPESSASVPSGTCKYRVGSGPVNVTGMLAQTCIDTATSRGAAHFNVPAGQLGVYVTWQGSQFDVNSAYGQLATFITQTQVTCPAGQIQTPDGLGCVADPAAVCQAKTGQTFKATIIRAQGADYPPEVTSDGCLAVPVGGVGVCLFVNPASPETSALSCHSDYRYTGAPGSVSAPAPDEPVTAPADGVLVQSQTTVTGTPAGSGGEVKTVTGSISVETNEGPPSVQTVNKESTVTTTTTETTAARPGGGTEKTTDVVVVTSGGAVYTVTGGTGQASETKPTVGVSSLGTSTQKGTAKETTYPDGSKSGTCEGPSCGEGGEDEVTKYTGAACKSIPTCTGDPIQCAQAVNAWRTQCQIQLDNERIFGTEAEDKAAREALEAERIETPDEMESKLGVTTVDVADYVQFAENLFPVAASCPADQSVSIMGHAFGVSYAPFCQFADVVRPIVILVAYILAAIILFRAIAGK